MSLETRCQANRQQRPLFTEAGSVDERNGAALNEIDDGQNSVPLRTGKITFDFNVAKRCRSRFRPSIEGLQ